VHILVVNAGSSSVKVRVVDDHDVVAASHDLGAPGSLGSTALVDTIADLRPFDAVGHRIVHGGLHYTAPVMVDERVLADLRELVDMAPLHQPAGLAALAAVARVAPEVPVVACFDTAFHATLPRAASTYAIPGAWRRLGVRRFGFHGLAHRWMSERYAAIRERDPERRERLAHARLPTPGARRVGTPVELRLGDRVDGGRSSPDLDDGALERARTRVEDEDPPAGHARTVRPTAVVGVLAGPPAFTPTRTSATP